MTPEVEETVTAKPNIIKYYNQTKGGVDNMDKLLSKYSTKRRTNRWPLSLFFNIIDVSAVAAFVIYMEHNQKFTSTNRRRKFLKDLSLELCKANIEERAQNPIVTGKVFVRTAMQEVLGREIRPLQSNVQQNQKVKHLDSTGRTTIVGSCYLCRELNCKQRKTRKSCVLCNKSTCDEHSVNQPKCNTCL